jgi:hypothetical protein
MTDREVYEWLYRHYEKPDKSEKIEEWEKQQADFDAAYVQKPLEERKAEFWAMCREWGCKEDEIAAQWEAYLKGEG